MTAESIKSLSGLIRDAVVTWASCLIAYPM